MADHVGRLVFAILGFSASFLWYFPALLKRQHKEIRREKLKMLKEVLEQAEERLAKHEERHDRLLGQVCSHYLINQNMEEALGGARQAMTEALEYVVAIRRSQIEIINSFPGEEVSILGWLQRKTRGSGETRLWP